MDEWLADVENDYEKWGITKFYGNLTYLNALAESDSNDKIYIFIPAKKIFYNFQRKQVS